MVLALSLKRPLIPTGENPARNSSHALISAVRACLKMLGGSAASWDFAEGHHWGAISGGPGAMAAYAPRADPEQRTRAARLCAPCRIRRRSSRAGVKPSGRPRNRSAQRRSNIGNVRRRSDFRFARRRIENTGRLLISNLSSCVHSRYDQPHLRTAASPDGLLIVDYSTSGKPLGIEITARRQCLSIDSISSSRSLVSHLWQRGK